MEILYNLIMNNIYIYLCLIIGLIVLTSILSIVIFNDKKRRKIKNDFIQAEKIEEEMKSEEKSNISTELEAILNKMQQDIDTKPEDVVKKFEQEQEDNAIISYQELIDNVKAGKIDVVDEEESEIDYVQELNIDLNKEPIMNTITQGEDVVTPDMIKSAVENISISSIKEEPKKFKKSEFISPVYGIVNNTVESNSNNKETLLDIMNTKDYNALTEEIKVQEEFLNILKEFRKNL